MDRFVSGNLNSPATNPAAPIVRHPDTAFGATCRQTASRISCSAFAASQTRSVSATSTSTAILERHSELAGDHYWLLTSAADVLEQHHPLAATLMLRGMVGFALDKATSKRYGHAARHLKTCEHLAKRIEGWACHPDHEAWVADLQHRHGRKTAFWSA